MRSPKRAGAHRGAPPRRWVRSTLLYGGGLVLTVGAVFLVLSQAPVAPSRAASGPVVQAGDPGLVGSRIRPYRALYETRSWVLGLPVKRGQVRASVHRTPDSLVVGYDFGGFVDQILMDPATLAPIARTFPGQDFVFFRQRVEALVGGGSEPLVFDFPQAVFEVSVLDLVEVAAGEGERRLAWDNFNAPEGSLAHVSTVRHDTLDLPDGTRVATRVVDMGFADGRVRRYWLSDRPPYKIRQRTFERGRAIVSGWDLIRLDDESAR